MAFLVNTSNLVIGGGIQVGVWFIRQCLERDIDCYFAISRSIANELENMGVDINTERFSVFVNSPAKDRDVRKQLLALSTSLPVSAVYTVFGPAYVKFTKPHLSGFADGWVSHSNWKVFRRVFSANLITGLKLLLTSLYKIFWIRNADQWVFEAEVAADGLASRARIPRAKCHVVSNNCSDRFSQAEVTPINHKQPFTLLYLTADYPHKGVVNYLHYAKGLKQMAPDFDFCFRISIAPDSPSAKIILSEARASGLEQHFDFCGYVPVANAVEVMDSANVVMQTSYLETFSANYPEAMARQRPLIVSDFQFARNICHDAALYVDPDNYQQMAETIIKLSQNKELEVDLIQNGKQVLSALPDSDQRFEQYLKLIATLS